MYGQPEASCVQWTANSSTSCETSGHSSFTGTGGRDAKRAYVTDNRVGRDEVMGGERGSVDGALVTNVYCLRNAFIAERVVACASRARVDKR